MRAEAALAEGYDGGPVVARRRIVEQREILPGPDQGASKLWMDSLRSFVLLALTCREHEL